MTNRQAEEAAEAMFWTIAMFQKGYEAIRKENKGLDNDDIMALTSIWWDGVMTMVGVGQQSKDDPSGLF